MSTAEILSDLMHFNLYAGFFEEELVAAVNKASESGINHIEQALEAGGFSSRYTPTDKEIGWSFIQACLKTFGRELTKPQDSSQLPLVYPALSTSSIRNTLLKEKLESEEAVDTNARDMSEGFVKASELWKDMFGSEHCSFKQIQDFALRSNAIAKQMVGGDFDEEDKDEGDSDPDSDTVTTSFMQLIDSHVVSCSRAIREATDREAALEAIFSLGHQGGREFSFSCYLVLAFSTAPWAFAKAWNKPVDAKKLVLGIDNLSLASLRDHFGRLREWACRVVDVHSGVDLAYARCDDKCESEDDDDSDKNDETSDDETSKDD